MRDNAAHFLPVHLGHVSASVPLGMMGMFGPQSLPLSLSIVIVVLIGELRPVARGGGEPRATGLAGRGASRPRAAGRGPRGAGGAAAVAQPVVAQAHSPRPRSSAATVGSERSTRLACMARCRTTRREA